MQKSIRIDGRRYTGRELLALCTPAVKTPGGGYMPTPTTYMLCRRRVGDHLLATHPASPDVEAVDVWEDGWRGGRARSVQVIR